MEEPDTWDGIKQEDELAQTLSIPEGFFEQEKLCYNGLAYVVYPSREKNGRNLS